MGFIFPFNLPRMGSDDRLKRVDANVMALMRAVLALSQRMDAMAKTMADALSALDTLASGVTSAVTELDTIAAQLKSFIENPQSPPDFTPLVDRIVGLQQTLVDHTNAAAAAVAPPAPAPAPPADTVSGGDVPPAA